MQEKWEKPVKIVFFIVKWLDKIVAQCYSNATQWQEKLCNIL